MSGLPWWNSGWGSTCQCRGYTFDPWSGKILNAVEKLSPCATTTEPEFQSPWATTTEPMHHNHWDLQNLGPVCQSYWACILQMLRSMHLELMLFNRRGQHSERLTHHGQEWPPLTATTEDLGTSTKTQCSRKNKRRRKEMSIKKPIPTKNILLK